MMLLKNVLTSQNILLKYIGWVDGVGKYILKIWGDDRGNKLGSDDVTCYIILDEIKMGDPVTYWDSEEKRFVTGNINNIMCNYVAEIITIHDDVIQCKFGEWILK